MKKIRKKTVQTKSSADHSDSFNDTAIENGEEVRGKDRAEQVKQMNSEKEKKEKEAKKAMKDKKGKK